MSVDVAELLRRSTSRAKSDVANKLVSMLLHEVSRQICSRLGMTVGRSVYPRLVADYFGSRCPYCRSELVVRNVAVEHLDGMNRLRAGLHIPGNVIVACHECNHEKRRDDQLVELESQGSGWASFLKHDSVRCQATCKGCSYWALRMPDRDEREEQLKFASNRIAAFRDLPELRPFRLAAEAFRANQQGRLVAIYRQGQDFASGIIREAAESIAKWENDQRNT